MKKLKKTVSLLTIILLIVTFYSSAMAMNDSIVSTPVKDIEVITKHVSKLLPMLQQISVNKGDIVSIGNALASYRANDDGTIVNGDYEEYPLMINNCVVGIVNVIRVDGEIYQVSLGANYAPELQKLVSESKNEAFAIIHTKDGVYAKLSSSSVSTLKLYVENKQLISKVNLGVDSKINYKEITQEGFVSINSIISPQAITRSKVLGVRHVPNVTPTCSEEGLCWAASIAMMSNYHRMTNYNAYDVHRICGCLFVENYHYKEITFIEQLGMTAQGPYYSTNSSDNFNYNNLYKLTDAYKLLMLDLEGVDKYGKPLRHNVIVHGYEVDESSARFHYMDPNTGAVVSTFPSSPYAVTIIAIGDNRLKVHCYITSE
jgi:hypothetical protein